MAELALAVVGLAVTIPTLIQPTIKTIDFIRETIHTYKTADERQKRLILLLDMHLEKVKNFACFIQNLCRAPSSNDRVDDTSLAILVRIIPVLNVLLDDFSQQLSAMLDDGRRLRRLIFAFRGRSNALQKLLQELDSWERSFQDVIFSICLSAGHRIPTSLAGIAGTAASSLPVVSVPPQATTALNRKTNTVTDLIRLVECSLTAPNVHADLHIEPVSSVGCVHIPHSLLLYNDCAENNSEQPFFLETHKPLVAAATDPSDLKIESVAAFLRSANPELVALLPCRGYFVRAGIDSQPPSHTLVLHIPQGLAAPRTLRASLLQARTLGVKHRLDERLTLMKRLASALLFIHTARHIHKRICADNVVLFTETGAASWDPVDSTPSDAIGEPFLVGFDLSRSDVARSDWTATHDFHKAYYLPVDRQGDPVRRYSMLDDIYSLGVLLLEIALWKSLVQYETRETSSKWTRTRAMLDRDGAPLSPPDLHKRLVHMARKEVARTMGSTISGLVVSCLTCLDEQSSHEEGEESASPGMWMTSGERDDLANPDGIAVGRSYIKKVVMVLDTVSL